MLDKSENRTIKIVTLLDLLGTLLIEQLGMSMKYPAWHPFILITAGGMTFVLLKWRNQISFTIISGINNSVNEWEKGLATLKADIDYFFEYKPKPAIFIQKTPRAEKKREKPVIIVEPEFQPAYDARRAMG